MPPGQPDPAHEADRRPLWQRLGWFVALWAMSIAVLGTVAAILRAWLN